MNLRGGDLECRSAPIVAKNTRWETNFVRFVDLRSAMPQPVNAGIKLSNYSDIKLSSST